MGSGQRGRLGGGNLGSGQRGRLGGGNLGSGQRGRLGGGNLGSGQRGRLGLIRERHRLVCPERHVIATLPLGGGTWRAWLPNFLRWQVAPHRLLLLLQYPQILLGIGDRLFFHPLTNQIVRRRRQRSAVRR
uniref:Uncharacterized protein n=1 Tax=viral metagenome TaxID=1070528 RepID=A0A6M3K8U3_9ZZZZ